MQPDALPAGKSAIPALENIPPHDRPWKELAPGWWSRPDAFVVDEHVRAEDQPPAQVVGPGPSALVDECAARMVDHHSAQLVGKSSSGNLD